MDDLISRQAALDAIKAWYADYPLDMQEPISDCWNAVRELPAVQPEQHWIPCSEKLPETYGAYLVQDVYGVIFVDHWRGDWLAKTTMVAWRELPEPYKGGDAG